MPKVSIPNLKVEFEVPQGSNLRDGLRREGVEVYQGLTRYVNCFGHGTCGECRVLVKKGMENLNAKTVMEKINMNLHPLSMLASIGYEDEMRLSCQVQVNGDCTIETTPAFNLCGDNFWQKPYPNK